jgi:propanol-preferring alcohol dehydrogenase
MRAAVVHQLGHPLTIDDRPDPQPGPGEVVIRLEASGLCHTDIHAAHGDWPVKPAPPFVPGHEGVGRVETVGAGVDPGFIGRRVAVPWLHRACGTCEFCVAGWETLCLGQQNSGYSVDGCYAELVKASAAYIVPVPESIDPLDAAPLTCAGVTTYKAVKVAGVRPAELVAVFGVGGLGHLAVQYARIAGATVVAVDVTEDKLALAKRLGAEHTINAATTSPADALRELGGAHAAIVTAAEQVPVRQAFDSLRRRGRLVLVGLPARNEVSLPIFETVLGGLTVTGSIVGTRLDLAEVFALHVAGRTEVIRQTRRLEEVNEAFEEVLRGTVPARLVFDLSPA